MKKEVLSLLAFLGVLSLFAVFTQTARADVNYDITDMNVTAKVNRDGQNVVPSNSGKNNTYQLTRYGKSYRFKVFHRIDEDDNVKVEYSYKILNAITNYKDTAELNFNLKTDKYRNRFFDAYGRDKVDESKLEILAAAEVFG